MPEIQTGITTPGTDPIIGEPPDVNSLAELGINTEETPGAEIAPINPDPAQPATPAPDEDIVGAALKRGRPARELDGLDEAEQKLFKSMSREAYEKLYPIYKKVKGHEADFDQLPSLKEKLAALEKSSATRPAAYYDHEEAYLLQQDFREALLQSNKLRDVYNHWQEQLAAAEEGKPIRDLSVDQNGNLQLGPPIESSPRAKAQIHSLLMQSNQELATHQQKLEQIKSQHSQQFKSYKTGLDSVYEKFFGKYKDQLAPLAAKELEVFPEFARSRPEINLLGHAMALIRGMVQADKATQTQAAVGKANANGQKIAGPTMRNITTAPRENSSTTNVEEEKLLRMKFGI
jgi:hypothetical protein